MSRAGFRCARASREHDFRATGANGIDHPRRPRTRFAWAMRERAARPPNARSRPARAPGWTSSVQLRGADVASVNRASDSSVTACAGRSNRCWTTSPAIDRLAVEVPDGEITGSGFAMLLDLAEGGVMAILEFVAKDLDGNAGTGAPVSRPGVAETRVMRDTWSRPISPMGRCVLSRRAAGVMRRRARCGCGPRVWRRRGRRRRVA
jgi:hypothetical protein